MIEEFDIDLIAQLDLDKYVNWVLQLKPEGLKPSKETVQYFAMWRKDALDSSMGPFRAWLGGGNPLPPRVTADQYGKYVCDNMTEAECLLVSAVVNALFIKADYDLAWLVGKLDFLKWLYVTRDRLAELPGVDNSLPVQFNIKSIFTIEYPDLYRDLLIELDVIDAATGKSNLSVRKGAANLFAAIKAIKHYSSKVLVKNYTVQELLNFFNSDLGSSYKEVKTGSKAYKAWLPAGKDFIKKRLKT